MHKSPSGHKYIGRYLCQGAILHGHRPELPSSPSRELEFEGAGFCLGLGSSSRRLPMHLTRELKIGKFKVVRRLGRGGMGAVLRSLRHVASSSCRHQNTPRARTRRRGLQATLRARGPSRGKVAASEHRDHPRTGEFRQRGKALHRHGISQGLRPLFRYPRRRVDSVGRIARCRFSALPGARLRAPTRGHSSGCETVQHSLPRRRSREDHGLRHCPHGRHASNYSERRADGKRCTTCRRSKCKDSL